MSHSHSRPRLGFLILALAAALTPAVALAHGTIAAEPSAATLITGWQLDPFLLLPLGFVAYMYGLGVKRVNRLHPKAHVQRQRILCFYSGIGALIVALVSPLAAYDTDLFSLHMAQHMLLIMVAAPLLLMGTPITLALRAASPSLRKGLLLPLLHSHVVRAISFPVVTWFALAATMWITHYSPVFNDALENVWWHRLEHIWYMTVALLFWWPVVALDPAPMRLPHPVRLLYIFTQMPQNSFLGVSIYGTNHVIFPHYANLVRTWGTDALSDQQIAGAIMWMVGDMGFLAAFVAVTVSWVRLDQREAERGDKARAKQRAAAGAATSVPSEQA